jgi:hypothetical protein
MIQLVLAVAALQATASVSPAAPAAGAATPPVQVAPVKKKVRHKSCDTGETSLGSHIVMDTCPAKDDFATARDNMIYRRDQSHTDAPGEPH